MCTCLLPRKPSWGGLFTSARTWPVHYSMLGAQQMYAPGGPAPRRPAWTKTTPTLVSISILCLVVQVGQVTCHTSGGHLLTLWTLQWSSWREQDTRGGAKCRCYECEKLKKQEDKWICRLGTFYGGNGLNSRDEIKARSRVNFVGSWRKFTKI